MRRFLSAFIGVHEELRRLRELLEWTIEHHPAMEDIGLPPTGAEVKAAEKERIEALLPPDEEELAEQAALEVYRNRAKGLIDENDDGWDLFT